MLRKPSFFHPLYFSKFKRAPKKAFLFNFSLPKQFLWGYSPFFYNFIYLCNV